MLPPPQPDPLSDVLALLKPHSYMAGAMDFAGEWSIRFDPHPGIKCYAIVSGSGWIVVDGESEPVAFAAGDCFLLPRGVPFTLTNSLALPPTSAAQFFQQPAHGRVITVNGGGESFGVAGHFLLSGSHARILLQELPAVVRIQGETEKQELRWLIDRMRQE